MPGTTSTALASFSHDQHHKIDAAKRKRGGATTVKTQLSDMAQLQINHTMLTHVQKQPVIPSQTLSLPLILHPSHSLHFNDRFQVDLA